MESDTVSASSERLCGEQPGAIAPARRQSRDFANLGWWYWCATVVLFALPLSRVAPDANVAAVGLGAVQAIHFYCREGAVRAYPVQVRIAYLGLLVLGLWSPLAVIHWMQLAGTLAVVIANYCPLARLLSLAPWNRSGPVNAAAVRFALLTPPGQWRHMDARRNAAQRLDKGAAVMVPDNGRLFA
jgi:hypothetical protein